MEVEITGDLSTSTSVDVNKSTDSTKRPSFAEKLMSVKNTQCDQYLARVQEKIDHSRMRNIQKLREETNRISYDFKEIKVNQKKRELEVKKKQNPYLDTEQDEFELMRAEKYMVFNPNICFYTNKKNNIPIRSRAKLDPFHVTASVAKARKILQDMTTEKHVQQIQEKRALMHSRKSAHSVRFNIQSRAGEEQSDENAREYRSKFRTPSPEKSYDRYHSPTRQHSHSPTPGYTTNSTTKKSKASTPQCTTVTDPYDIPDDFIQCTARHGHTHNTKTPNNYSQEETTFQLPSMTSQQRAQSYFNNSKSSQEETGLFKELEKEVPAHELRLLKEASEPHRDRPSRSAVMRRTPSQVSHYGKRFASASTTSSKKRQFTHSAMRRENRDVQVKVQYFLRGFDKHNKKQRFQQRESSCQSPDDKQTVTFDVPDGKKSSKYGDIIKRPVSETASKELEDESRDEHTGLIRAKTALPRQNTGTGEPQTTAASERFFYGAQRVISALSSQEKPKRKGIPHHSQDRSSRHTATSKLRKVVEELIKNRTTHQIMEAEKMLKSGSKDYKMPEQDTEDM